MKIKYYICMIALAVASIASADEISPITRALLRGYDELLREDPRDYETLYQRGATYYKLSKYDEALLDLVKAIDCTPVKETEMRVDEFSMMADIYIQTKEYEKALRAVNNALALNPADYSMLYKKGNIELYLGNADDAYKTFRTMQSIRSRSQEAFFGMAKASIMMGQYDQANSLLKEAENADPNSSLTYCRIGDLYLDMKDNRKAADSYLSAFSMNTGDDTRPLESLLSLARTDYNAVEAALDYALAHAQNKLPLYFLQGNIAFEAGRYDRAYQAFDALLNDPEGKLGAIYAQMAETCVALDKMIEARSAADMGVTKDPGIRTYLAKAYVERADDNNAAAILAADKALKIDPNCTPALIEMAKAYINLHDGENALAKLNEAVMNDPENLEPLLLRAYVNFNLAADARQSILDYGRAGSTDQQTFKGKTLKALAQTKNGKKLDGDSSMQKLLNETYPLTGEDFYWAAVYYAQTDNIAKGKELMQKAKDADYQNLFNLEKESCANLNLSPLR